MLVAAGRSHSVSSMQCRQPEDSRRERGGGLPVGGRSCPHARLLGRRIRRGHLGMNSTAIRPCVLLLAVFWSDWVRLRTP